MRLEGSLNVLVRSLTGRPFGGSNHEGQDGLCSFLMMFLGWNGILYQILVCLFGGGEKVYIEGS